MDAHVLLADYAQVDPSGKVNALGLGWNVTSTPTAPHAVIVLLRLTAVDLDSVLHLTLRLTDAHGSDVVVPTEFGNQPLHVEADVEVERPTDDLVPTTDHAVAVNIGAGLTLTPGRYEWRLRVDQKRDGEWAATFTVDEPGTTS